MEKFHSDSHRGDVLPPTGHSLAGSLVFVLCLSGLTDARAQQLTPRAYWPAPIGTNVLVLTYQRSEGDLVVDQSLPVTGVESIVDYAAVTYQHSFDWRGRSASFSLAQGAADGTTVGEYQGEEITVRTVGAQDTVARVAVNFRGAPAMNREEFRALRLNPATIFGASLTVTAPTGDYDKDKVINLGTNRWTAKPGIGMIHPLSSTWLLEVDAGVWFFQDNDEFVGSTREQDPVIDLQVHLVKRFSPGFWGSLDVNYYTGGRTRIDGLENADLQRNSRLGATLVVPLAPRHALRASLSTGTVTETGGDFEILSLAWIHAF